VPNTATSTPINRRGQSMKDLGISPVPEGELNVAEDSPQMMTRQARKARRQLLDDGLTESPVGPSQLRDDTGNCDDMRIDYDGTFFFDDPTTNSDRPIDLTIDLDHMRDYYHLGITAADPASISQMEQSMSDLCCIPAAKCWIS
ncbi:MAG: hypothetical protein AAFN81_33325, partial [Bacteroidota bacterium]